MISVVVVTYNSAACVGPCLESVLRHLPGSEVIVVDNDSDDDTARVVADTARHSRLLRMNRNLGFGRACNVGVGAASHDAALILNPDVHIVGVDVTAFARLLAVRPLGLVAPALDGHPTDRLRAENPWLNDLLHHTVFALRPREWAPRRHARRHSGEAALWVTGAMLLIDRREFLTLGGFDERFFLYYEDRELSRRYQTAGLPIRTTEALSGRHEGGASSANDGLYVGPMTWSLLGWVQFLYLKDGERSARRAARAALKTLRAMRLGLRALYLVAPRWKRLGRKREQIEELLAAVHSAAEAGTREFCPDALRLLGRPDVRSVTGELP